MASAKTSAIQDIKDDLKQCSKSFLAFRKQLDETMDTLVKEYTKLQEKMNDKTRV